MITSEIVFSRFRFNVIEITFYIYSLYIKNPRRSAAIRITDALRTTFTKALVAMLNWIPTELFAKQVAKFTSTRLSALSHWLIVPCGHSSILDIDPVASLDIDYLSVEYCFDGDFNLLIPSRSD